VHVALEDRDVRLGEPVAAEPAGDRRVEGGGALERARGESAPRGTPDLTVCAELGEEALVVLGPADGDDVRVVLRRGSQQRGPADVDLLDRVLPRDIEAPHGALERVEVDADKIDRLDAVRPELRHVL